MTTPAPDATRFSAVAVVKKANVYFDGKCVSHTVEFPDGIKKSVGVILPSRLTFATGVPEVMEVLAGSARVTLQGETDAKTYGAGESFAVPGASSFDIETTETLHYVCHFG